MKSKQSKQASGGARLRASGKRPILLGVTAAHHDLLRAAAEIDGIAITQFVVTAALTAARKKIRNSE